MSCTPPRVIVTMVHGTFAADGDWYRDDSTFRQQLTQYLKTKFTGAQIVFDDALFTASSSASQPGLEPYFAWGQTDWTRWWRDNTNAARTKGAAWLKDRIDEIANNHLRAGDLHYLVAHSHGGNVALYALRENSTVEGLVCLATPFLYPRKSKFPLLVPWICLIVLSIGIFASQGIIDLADVAGVDLVRNWNIGVWSLKPLWRDLVVGSFALSLLFLTFFKFRSHSATLEEHIRLLKFDSVSARILIVRGSGDEASFVLRWGQFANWFSRHMIQLLGKPAKIVLLPPTMLLLIHYVIPPLNAAEADGADWVVVTLLPQIKMISTFILTVLSGFVPFIFLLLTIARWSVGFDAARWTCELETMAEDCPPGLEVTASALRPVDGPANGMVHSVYDRPETAKLIADWC